MKNYHISKKDKFWQFKETGSKNPIKQYKTKAEALDDIKNLMRDKIGSVKIHKKNGEINEERTYQRKNDPKKSKG